MKLRSSFGRLLIILTGIALLTIGTTMGSPVLPMQPKELLSLLPKAPEGWRLTTSRSYNEATGNPELVTIAIREYSYNSPLGTTSTGDKVPAPKTANITLVDAAGDKTRFSLLDQMGETGTEQSRRPPQRKYFVGDVPIREISSGNKNIVFAAFNSRLLLILTLTNSDEKEIKDWLARLDFKSLNTAAKNAPISPLSKNVLVIVTVDELNSGENRTSEMRLQGED